jgi:hypothetical protein
LIQPCRGSILFDQFISRSFLVHAMHSVTDILPQRDTCALT